MILTTLVSYSPGILKAAQKPKVTFVISLDLSDSLKGLRPRIASVLSSVVEQAMTNNLCEVQVAVGNLRYHDRPNALMKPLGEPGFVSSKTPNAAELIRQRITEPFVVGALTLQSDNAGSLNGDHELTYSSVAEFIQYNSSAIQGQDTVVSVLVTDAAPAYESMGPLEALKVIQGSIGTAIFFPGVLAPTFAERMLVRDSGRSCQPDFPDHEYDRVEKQRGRHTARILPRTWLSKDPFAMDTFVNEGGGLKRDICEDDTEHALKEIIFRALLIDGCLILS